MKKHFLTTTEFNFLLKKFLITFQDMNSSINFCYRPSLLYFMQIFKLTLKVFPKSKTTVSRTSFSQLWEEKVSIERLCISLLMSKNLLNTKRWIKVSYLNQVREIRVFGFLYMFMNILWTLCTFHLSVLWGCYTTMKKTFSIKVISVA